MFSNRSALFPPAFRPGPAGGREEDGSAFEKRRAGSGSILRWKALFLQENGVACQGFCRNKKGTTLRSSL
jgi:hypothetical protein